ncbi:hypothetical protein AAH979_07690 [Plantactinospora sp. ZYX-F-223]|uniref:hypothetical protein n=1 Tax=Plantactinospora sp. ZYX-F-223 TaxID=3144103 RepID=UPI0031FD8F1D
MSPPSARGSHDRATPALYAKAGIPYYCRIETKGGLAVHTHRLDPVEEIYVETGRWTKFVDTGEPWPVNLPISRLPPATSSFPKSCPPRPFPGGLLRPGPVFPNPVGDHAGPAPLRHQSPPIPARPSPDDGHRGWGGRCGPPHTAR